MFLKLYEKPHGECIISGSVGAIFFINQGRLSNIQYNDTVTIKFDIEWNENADIECLGNIKDISWPRNIADTSSYVHKRSCL